MTEHIPCELVSWTQVQDLARELAFSIRGSGFRPELIVAVGRGGYIPGRLVSDYLNNLNLTEFKVEHYTATDKEPEARVRYPLTADPTGLRVLLVDDVTDTGDSFEVAVGHVRSRGEPAELRTAVLHHKTVSPFVPDYYASHVTDWRWIIYPWAFIEDLSALIRKMGLPAPDVQTVAARLAQDPRRPSHHKL